MLRVLLTMGGCDSLDWLLCGVAVEWWVRELMLCIYYFRNSSPPFESFQQKHRWSLKICWDQRILCILIKTEKQGLIIFYTFRKIVFSSYSAFVLHMFNLFWTDIFGKKQILQKYSLNLNEFYRKASMDSILNFHKMIYLQL